MSFNIIIPRETLHGEQRVAVVPEDVSALKRFGKIFIEKGAGIGAGFTNEEYLSKGAEIIDIGESPSPDLQKLYGQSQLILRVKRASREREIVENHLLPRDVLMIGFLSPLDKTTPHVDEWRDRQITTVTLDQLPFDQQDEKNVLAAMSRIAGQLAVRDALTKNPKANRVVVIGTGSVGLSAIDESLRNGLEAHVVGTRPQDPNTAYQFLHLPPSLPLSAQQEKLRSVLENADIVIASARRANERAPLLIPKSTLEKMKPGSVIVDLSLTEGGNVEGSVEDQTLKLGNGVIVTNQSGYPKLDPRNASILFSKCMVKIVEALWQEKFKGPLVEAAFVTRDGKVNPQLATHNK
jgi:NAD(P) transhydrogenase subunit alpha